MKNNHYYICKKNNQGELIYINYDKLKGFDISPRNNVKYDGIVVNKMIIINPSMIQKLLKRKIKKKLELYLNLIIKFVDNNDSDNDGETFREALNDLSKYKSIIQYKYKKYLDEKYLKLLNKKIEIVECELKSKLLNKIKMCYEEDYIEEKTSHRHR